MTMARLPAYILAGGKSTRFGTDKARALVDGQALIQRTALVLAEVADSVVVVAGESDEYADLGLETIADVEPDLGPLGGILTALQHAQQHGHEQVLVVPCDALGLDTQWLEDLAQANADAMVVLFDTEPLHPLIGRFSTELIPYLRVYLAADFRAAHRFALINEGLRLPEPENWQAMRNVNRPDDLEPWQ